MEDALQALAMDAALNGAMERNMQGYQLTFFTQQDRRHGRTPLGEWLLQEALKMGVGGATLTAGALT